MGKFWQSSQGRNKALEGASTVDGKIYETKTDHTDQRLTQKWKSTYKPSTAQKVSGKASEYMAIPTKSCNSDYRKTKEEGNKQLS